MEFLNSETLVNRTVYSGQCFGTDYPGFYAELGERSVLFLKQSFWVQLFKPPIKILYQLVICESKKINSSLKQLVCRARKL